jgi:hypothetical protein
MLLIWGDFLEKSCKKPTTQVNRNSQSYALGKYCFAKHDLPERNVAFEVHSDSWPANNADLNVCLKFFQCILVSGKFHLLTAA